jgi:hypothetical protein
MSDENQGIVFSPEHLAFLGVESIDEAKSILESARESRQKAEDEEHAQLTSAFDEKQRAALSVWFGSEKKDQVNALKMLRDLGLAPKAEKKQTVVSFKAPKSAPVDQVDHAARHAELRRTNPIQAAAYFAAHGREIMTQKKGA